MSAISAQYIHKKQCAFCENIANSDEHVMPQWLDKVLEPRKHEDFSFQSKTKAKTGGENSPVVKKRNGNPRSKRLKVVCQKCNNEWMSVLQDLASKIIIKMIKNEDFFLSMRDKEILAAWSTMATMVFEFDDIDTMSILESERFWFRSLRLPPQGEWRIFVGTHVGEAWKCRLFHAGYGMAKKNDIPLVVKLNTQKTVFGIENLHFMIFSTRLLTPSMSPFNLSPSEFAAKNNLIQLWPPTGEISKWHCVEPIADSSVTEISYEHAPNASFMSSIEIYRLKRESEEKNASNSAIKSPTS